MDRLQQLDREVEHLRAALAALQRQLATTRPASNAPQATPDDYLRAYV